MKKVYQYKEVTATTEEDKEFLKEIVKVLTEAKNSLEYEDYEKFTLKLYDSLRKIFGFPNEIFTFGTSKETGEVVLLLFEKECDGKVYTPQIDEDGYMFIEVEDLKEEEIENMSENTFNEEEIVNLEEKGWTVVYYPWDDMDGKPRVAGRFKTKLEKNDFLNNIHKPDSGWMEEELMSIEIHNDYNYVLPF